MVSFDSNPELLRYFIPEKLIELGLMEPTPVKLKKTNIPQDVVQHSLTEKLEALKQKLPVISSLKTNSPQRQLFQ